MIVFVFFRKFLEMANHDDEVLDVLDDDAEVALEGMEKLLSQYFEQPDDQAFRKCKICAKFPSGQRGSAGAIVSCCFCTIISITTVNVFILESQSIVDLQFHAAHKAGP